MRLKDKALIITGSTTGIGEAIARRCAAEGASVLVHGRDLEQGERIAAELGAPVVIADLADPATPQRLVDEAVAAFGKLDGLVNNAAFVFRGGLDQTTPELFDRVMTVNCRAPLFLIKAALPHLALTHGAVVNIGSVNAYCGEENLLPYSISKGALMTLSRNLGDSLMRHQLVRINHINPGWVLTPNEIRAKQGDGMEEGWWRTLPKMFAPSGRIFDPAEIAEAVIYFLSEASGPVSGQVLDIEQHPFIGRNPPKC
jgi:NAD(P)-dependent dehydrogenase (short-subunit alcohol dehydrogenase family)